MTVTETPSASPLGSASEAGRAAGNFSDGVEGEWHIDTTQSGRCYFKHSVTGEVVWARPRDLPHVRCLDSQAVEGWIKYIDPLGRPYYHDHMTRETVINVKPVSRSRAIFDILLGVRRSHSFKGERGGKVPGSLDRGRKKPLPSKWIELTDKEGKTYFFNVDTGKTSWEAPAEGVMPDGSALWVPHKTVEGKTYYHNLSTGEVSWSIPEPGSGIANPGGDWVKYQSPEGRTYYHNPKTGRTSWVVPKDGEADLAPLVNGAWMPHQAANGRTYYHNLTTGQVSWTIPVEGASSGAHQPSPTPSPSPSPTPSPSHPSPSPSAASPSPASPGPTSSAYRGPVLPLRPLPRRWWRPRGARASSGADRKPGPPRRWSLVDLVAWLSSLMGSGSSSASHGPQRVWSLLHCVCRRWQLPRLWRWCLLRAYPDGHGEGMAIQACPVDDLDATFADGVAVSEVIHVATQPFALVSKTRVLKLSVAGNVPIGERREYGVAVYVRELAGYPRSFLSRAGCEHVVIAADLSYDMEPRTAVPDSARRTLFLHASLHSEQYLRMVLHHDLFHMADYMMIGSNYVHGDEEWQALNKPGFRYGTGGESMQGEFNVQGLGTGGAGFLNKYATSSPAEDKAETFAALMCCPSALEGDEVLRAKAALIMRRVEALCPEMAGVWQRRRESVRAKTECMQRGEWEERVGAAGNRYWYHTTSRMTSVLHPEVAPVPKPLPEVGAPCASAATAQAGEGDQPVDVGAAPQAQQAAQAQQAVGVAGPWADAGSGGPHDGAADHGAQMSPVAPTDSVMVTITSNAPDGGNVVAPSSEMDMGGMVAITIPVADASAAPVQLPAPMEVFCPLDLSG